MKKFISVGEVAKIENVTTQTIRRWVAQGQYVTKKTQGGHLRIEYDYGKHKETILYCRVSSIKQKSSLASQERVLRSVYPEATVVQDIGSGFNFKRKNFKAILERVIRGDCIELVVTTPDRFTRSGFEFLRFILELQGGNIVVLEEDTASEMFDTTPLFSFLTSFIASHHGKRGNRNKKDKAIPKE